MAVDGRRADGKHKITPAQELLNEKALRASPEDLLGPLSTLSSSYWRHLRANGPQQ